MVDRKLLIVAGSGDYPARMALGARRAGVNHLSMIAIKGMTARSTAALADEVAWFGIGQMRAIFDWAEASACHWGVLAGQVRPAALFRTRFDDLSRQWLNELGVKNAHTIFGKIAAEMEKRNIRVIPASCFMDESMPGVGVLTRRAPDERERADIAFGHECAMKICGMDIGQTLCVKDGMVLAVEAFEGTNRAILRGGKLGGKGQVVVKVAKEGHDMRFDIPVVGEKTIKTLRKSGASALAFQAGRLLMLDREKTVALADRYGIAIVGLDSGLPPAPLRPAEEGR